MLGWQGSRGGATELQLHLPAFLGGALINKVANNGRHNVNPAAAKLLHLSPELFGGKLRWHGKTSPMPKGCHHGDSEGIDVIKGKHRIDTVAFSEFMFRGNGCRVT